MSRCPQCGAPEVDASTPSTVYSCGSSDYDQRPGTFRRRCAMSKELDEKWAELVANGRAKWMPGMRAIDSDGQAARVVQATGAAVLEDKESRSGFRSPTCPDWSDDATLGALLGQVRERWNDPYMVAEFWRGPRIWTCKSGRVHFVGVHGPRGKTEAAALLAALEAAP